ncbi:MAG: hypothetical protein JXK94_08175 [Deltaproteobacteria bacterium]|nr:hypothetical protein [Deltaproteobacteria bacterium]
MASRFRRHPHLKITGAGCLLWLVIAAVLVDQWDQVRLAGKQMAHF